MMSDNFYGNRGQTTFYDIEIQQKAGQIRKNNRGLSPIFSIFLWSFP